MALFWPELGTASNLMNVGVQASALHAEAAAAHCAAQMMSPRSFSLCATAQQRACKEL